MTCNLNRRRLMRAWRHLVLGLLALTSANATSLADAPIDKLATDAKLVVVGIVVVGVGLGVGITYLVLHNRGIAVGCITESGGKRILVVSNQKRYSLFNAGPSLPIGERAKLKGRMSGPASAPSFQVEKVLKDYGPCPP
jgi:hypothetical protein